MKQKLAIARTLLHHPSLVFLDEPTAGLDPLAAASLRDDLATLVEVDGVTVFLNTHNLTEAEKLCAQVGVIRHGKLVSVGSLDQLRTGEDLSRLMITGTGITQEVLDQLRSQARVKDATCQNSHVEVTLSDPNETSNLISFLISAGVKVEEVRKDRATLEEVFLKMMEEESHAH